MVFHTKTPLDTQTHSINHVQYTSTFMSGAHSSLCSPPEPSTVNVPTAKTGSSLGWSVLEKNRLMSLPKNSRSKLVSNF